MQKILMVCTANICRSPMALTVAKHIANETGCRNYFEFDSAGTHAQLTRHKPDVRAKKTLLKRGYEPGSTRSRQMSEQDFERFDMILAMDESNLATLKRRCPPTLLKKLHLFLAFAPEAGVKEVPDPYFGSLQGFERVLDLCEVGVLGLLSSVKNNTSN